MNLGSTRLLTIAAILIGAIILIIVAVRLTSPRPSPAAAGGGYDRCGVARQALDAFDRGKPPPAEWIQDRTEAAKAVRECDQK